MNSGKYMAVFLCNVHHKKAFYNVKNKVRWRWVRLTKQIRRWNPIENHFLKYSDQKQLKKVNEIIIK